ncbi:P-loop containing nucleoside triphosphate hydrolase protein [Chytridium lagenaria]|nr:P-loop containing nucleoside triphosphate hydrolase protein [Chytridium lagenaria]
MPPKNKKAESSSDDDFMENGVSVSTSKASSSRRPSRSASKKAKLAVTAIYADASIEDQSGDSEDDHWKSEDSDESDDFQSPRSISRRDSGPVSVTKARTRRASGKQNGRGAKDTPMVIEAAMDVDVDVEEASTSVQPEPTPQRRGAASRRGRQSSSNSRPPTSREGSRLNADQDDESDFLPSEADGSTSDSGSEEALENPLSSENRRRNGVNGAVSRRRQSGPKKLTSSEYFASMHPELESVWDDLRDMESITMQEGFTQPPNIAIKLLPFQLEGVNWLMNQEESRFNGGILADEMGMGKTIQLLSLLVSKPDVKPNLILTPTVAILQTSPDTLTVCLYHGASRETSAAKLQNYDVVLSTYAIVESGFRKQTLGFKRKGQLVKEKSILHTIPWGRVVLDEAHAIKDRSSSTARAVFNLNCRYKWSLSGTPLQNRVGELYSLIRFLSADPFSFYFCKKCPCKSQKWSFTDRRHCDLCGHISHSHFCWWNSEILKPIQKYGGAGDGLVAFKKLGLLLDKIMLRRTKVERANDLGLPPRVITVRRDVFNEAEEELYESLYSDSRRQFSTYVTANTLLNNYASIFSLLSRMRLAVNHPDLVTSKLENAKKSSDTLVCGICQDEAEDAILSKCKHVFCREDIKQYLLSFPEGQKITCPTCYRILSIDLSQEEYTKSSKSDDAPKASIINYIDMSKWRSSTKIEALVEELSALQKEDSTLKSIVFSQFVAFLDLIQWRLTRAGFSCVKLDGRMSPEARSIVISSFMTDPTVTIFLVSLKAGGVALNLTEASRVFILDPWWNPAVEDQAFDRIHRLGQTRPIKITRLIIENSIESRILQLQEKKKMLFQSTVGKDIDALAKLSEDDLRFLFVL